MRSDDFFSLTECCNRFRIIEQFGSRSDPAFFQALIRVQIDGKGYHNMTFICNQIRFSRDCAYFLTHIFLSNSLDLDKARLLSSLISLQTVWLSPSDTRMEQNQVFS